MTTVSLDKRPGGSRSKPLYSETCATSETVREVDEDGQVGFQPSRSKSLRTKTNTFQVSTVTASAEQQSKLKRVDELIAHRPPLIVNFAHPAMPSQSRLLLSA